MYNAQGCLRGTFFGVMTGNNRADTRLPSLTGRTVVDPSLSRLYLIIIPCTHGTPSVTTQRRWTARKSCFGHGTYVRRAGGQGVRTHCAGPLAKTERDPDNSARNQPRPLVQSGPYRSKPSTLLLRWLLGRPPHLASFTSPAI
jgi:hypothetical protein